LKKRFGQHFLSDPTILRRIVRFSGIRPEDTVVEIGPGGGSLTAELSAVAKRVIAIEIDRDLIAPLAERVATNVEIIPADALEVDFAKLSSSAFHLVGNLPYNVATALFKRFIEFRRMILSVTVMIQKEVAERVTAKPSDAAYGPLSVLIQYYAAPEYGFTVSPGAFRPKPKVDSAVIRLEWRANVPDAHEFTDFVQHAFGSRRKKLVNNLLRVLSGSSREQIIEQLDKANVPPDARPENLSAEDFLRLYNQICKAGGHLSWTVVPTLKK
jgi:16S rRNA (adenine1518-N6/adenine1519-N6)-dimethyltransferase